MPKGTTKTRKQAGKSNKQVKEETKPDTGLNDIVMKDQESGKNSIPNSKNVSV